MEQLPFYIYLVFGLTVLLAAAFFYKASNSSKGFLFLALMWILIQSIVSITGFYKVTHTSFPRLQLLIIPPVLFIIVFANTQKGKVFIEGINIKTLTLLHVVRIPIEIVLFWLSIHKAVPQLITFEGRNFDIFSGLSAPVVYYFGFVKRKLNRYNILFWNFICLGLLLNVVFYALLSAPTPFQHFAYNQPNIAITYFPFVLLPSFLVPLVLFSHIVSIKQLMSGK